MSALKISLIDDNFNNDLIKVINAESIVSATDVNGVIIYVNENFCHISGYDENELVGQPHCIINSKFHSKEFFSSMWKDIKAGKTWKGEMKNRRKDGTYYWVLSNIIPIKNQDGSIKYFISVRQDITQQKENQSSLFQASKLSSLGEVTAKVAHELNNPLAAIMGMSQLLIMRNEVKEKTLEKVVKILKSAERMNRLIQQMKKHSRDSKNDPKQAISLVEVIKNSIILLESTITSHQINLNLDLPEQVPMIWGDSIQLESVIMNLITNSIDAFIKPHSPYPISQRIINVTFVIQPTSITLIYNDNAGGIPEHVQKHMFDIFFTTKEVGKGMGLGLALIKNVAQEHQVELSFSSQLGVGTEFRLTFPLHRS